MNSPSDTSGFSAAAGQSSGTSPGPGKTRILLVDDHSDIRRLIKITLGPAYEVLEAEDGATALAIAQSRKPELIVLDVMMPGMDGIQVLDAIRADPSLSAMRVILVTARGQARDYDLGIEHGADAYFIKPFSPLQLVAKITAMLSERDHHD